MPHAESNTNSEQKPCRTCVDFKTWAKQQRGAKQSTKHEGERDPTMQKNEGIASDKGRFKYGCPMDKDELGRSTWNLLHTMAATYPEQPSEQQKQDVKSFFNILSRTYPCDVCAKDLVTELKDEPIATKSNHELSQWLCRLHNKVNIKIGKPVFDCTKVNERWRDGWLDGSCD